jgi:NTP pyrophosphatase (non-canonical NTP hydrolase)
MYGVRYFGELTNMTLLTEEVGELARVMARTYGEQSSKESDLSKNMSEEIGDILWVLICIANQTGVNLEESFLSSIEKKTKRDATRHLNNDKLKS